MPHVCVYSWTSSKCVVINIAKCIVSAKVLRTPYIFYTHITVSISMSQWLILGDSRKCIYEEHYTEFLNEADKCYVLLSHAAPRWMASQSAIILHYGKGMTDRQ